MDDDAIAWYENTTSAEPAPTFASTTITTSEDGAFNVYCVDMDKDGDLDVLIAGQLSNNLVWYENPLK